MDDPVTDTWLVGVVAHDEALSSVRVHAGYVAFGPASGRRHRVQVRLRYGSGKDPGRGRVPEVGADGPCRTDVRGGDPSANAATDPAFPDATTAADLIAREEVLQAILADVAVFVGALTVPGFRDLLFHTDDPDTCARVLAGSEVDLGSDDVAIVDDPLWSVYRAWFADAVPADADRRKLADLDVRSDGPSETGPSSPRSTADGETGGASRVTECRISHRFVFPSVETARSCAAALGEAGLEVGAVEVVGGADDDDIDGRGPSARSIEDRESHDDRGDPLTVQFAVFETEVLSQVDLARSRDVLEGFASSWGGSYRGWEPVPRERRPSATAPPRG